MDLPKKKIALAAGVAAVGILTVVAVMAARAASVRHEPAAKTSADEALRIVVVEPPRAPIKPTTPLDVRLPDAPQAVAQASYAPPGQAPAIRRVSSAPQPRAAPEAIIEPDDEVGPLTTLPAEKAQVRREAQLRDQFNQDRRWDEERLARETRDDRAAWEEAADRRRWEQSREQDRYEPDPDEGLPLPPFRW